MKRLYPALVGVVVAVSIFVVLFAGASRGQTLFAALYALLQLNTFAVPAGLPFWQPFGITWSLSAEWMSYLVLPLVVIAGRRLPRGTVAIIFGIIALVLYLAAAFALNPSWFYFGPVSRGAQVFAGGGIALLTVGLSPSRASARWFAPLGVLAAATIVAWGALGFIEMDPIYRWVGLPLVTVAAAVLICAGTLAPEAPITALLSWRPLAAVGRSSYSLYLWHTMPFVVLSPLAASVTPAAYVVLCSVVAATTTWLSYWYLERPFMRARSAALQPPPLPPSTMKESVHDEQ